MTLTVKWHLHTKLSTNADLVAALYETSTSFCHFSLLTDFVLVLIFLSITTTFLPQLQPVIALRTPVFTCCRFQSVVFLRRNLKTVGQISLFIEFVFTKHSNLPNKKSKFDDVRGCFLIIAEAFMSRMSKRARSMLFIKNFSSLNS